MPDETAVLLIDMQEEFVSLLRQSVKKCLVKAQVELLRYCAQADIPLFVLQYVSQYVSEEGIVEALWAAIESVPRRRFVTKRWDDAFTDTNLDGCLQELGVKTLVLSGLNASCCVQETAETAVCLGYKITTAHFLIANGVMWEHLFNWDIYQRHRRWYQKNGTFYRRAVPPKQLFAP